MNSVIVLLSDLTKEIFNGDSETSTSSKVQKFWSLNKIHIRHKGAKFHTAKNIYLTNWVSYKIFFIFSGILSCHLLQTLNPSETRGIQVVKLKTWLCPNSDLLKSITNHLVYYQRSCEKKKSLTVILILPSHFVERNGGYRDYTCI